MRIRNSIILVLLSIFSLSVNAQRDPAYSHLRLVSDTLRMEGYAYVCDTIGSFIVNLYNAENHPGREEIAYKDGTDIPFEKLLHDDIDAVVITDELDRLMRCIVDDAFTKEQSAAFDKWRLGFTLNISSTTGRITDVYFDYNVGTAYTDIPVGVYRGIEQRLKNEVVFTLTEEGRRLTYCFLGWSQIPKGREESNSSMLEDGMRLTVPDGGLNSTAGSVGDTVGQP